MSQSLNFRYKAGLIVPTRFEWDAMREAIEAEFSALPVLVPGMGKVRAAIAARDLAAAMRCRHVILAGFCGGVRSLRVGDAVSASLAFEGDFDSGGLEGTGNHDDILCHSVPIEIVEGINGVAFVCQDRLLKEDVYKDQIWHGTLATDMESYAAAVAVAGTESSFHVVKVVSDVVNQDSARDFKMAINGLAKKMTETTIEAIKKITKTGGIS